MKVPSYLCKVILIFAVFCSNQLSAQSLPVGTPVLEDAYRRAQLLGQVDSSISFSSRPLFASSFKSKNIFDPDSTLQRDRKIDGNIKFGRKNTGLIQVLPIIWQQQYNSHHPEGLNDGAMIPARGHQTMFSAGLYVKYGPLSIQFRPEIVYAENRDFEGFSSNQSDLVWAAYYRYYNTIDLPEKFGDKAYNKLLWGQSSVRLTVGAASIGLSNENLWWGPGMRNSLLMSNSAAGFKHFTLNTVRPIRTLIGSFEGQIIAGRNDASGFSPPVPDRVYAGNPPNPKPNDWRYLNGMVLSYQPKWIPGLFLGLTRSFQTYHQDLGKRFSDYLPLFTPFGKKAVGHGEEDKKRRNQLTSAFMRWLLLKEKAEFYFEFGRNDHSYDARDFLSEPEHSRAYIFGFRKLFPLNKYKGQCIQLNIEVIQLEANRSTDYRAGAQGAGSWYNHYQVKDGYTNRGQLIGAGIGPGSNLQTANISWNNSLKTIGIQFERYVHNNDFHYRFIKDIRAHWVDLSMAVFGEWNYKNVLFNAKMQAVSSINYQHFYKPIPSTPPQFWDPGKNVYNFQGQIGISYRF